MDVLKRSRIFDTISVFLKLITAAEYAQGPLKNNTERHARLQIFHKKQKYSNNYGTFVII